MQTCALDGCDTEYEPKRSTQNYCSVSHGQVAANRRRYHGLIEPTPEGSYQALPPRGSKHPEGWEPGVILEGNAGTVTAPATTDAKPDWDEILRHFKFDPAEFEILEPVNVRTWDAAIGGGEVRQMWYYRANIVRRTAPVSADVEALVAEIKRHKPSNRTRPFLEGQEGAFVVNLSDWQAGKGEGGGTEGMVARVLDMIEDVAGRVKELRRLGRQLPTLYVAGMGDLVENCDGHYPMQTFSVDLDRRDQVKLVRRLLVKALQRWSPLFTRVVVLCVPGNHGENRRDGKAFTTFGDNDDVAVFEQVHDILSENPEAYGHVSFVIPKDDLSVTLDVAGFPVAFAHGHQAKGAGKPQAKVATWWKEQMESRRPAGDAMLLVTGHYHHLLVVQNGPRTHVQCPALDGGSKWHDEAHGGGAPAGTLTFTVGKDGWRDLEVIRGAA